MNSTTAQKGGDTVLYCTVLGWDPSAPPPSLPLSLGSKLGQWKQEVGPTVWLKNTAANIRIVHRHTCGAPPPFPPAHGEDTPLLRPAGDGRGWGGVGVKKRAGCGQEEPDCSIALPLWSIWPKPPTDRVLWSKLHNQSASPMVQEVGGAREDRLRWSCCWKMSGKNKHK